MVGGTAAAPDRMAVFKFCALTLTWSASFMLTTITLQELSVGLATMTRTLLATAVLWAVLLLRRTPLPRLPRVYAHMAVVGLLNITIPLTAFSYGQLFVASAEAAMFNAATPLLVVGWSVLLRLRRTTWREIALLGIAFGGVLLVLRIHEFASLDPSLRGGQLACLAAVLSISISLVYIDRFVRPYRVDTSVLATLMVSAGAIGACATMPFLGLELRTGTISPHTIVALLVIGAITSGLNHIWNLDLIQAWGPTAASTMSYLIPIGALLLGTVFLHERLTWVQLVGAAIVVASVVVFGQLSRRRTAR